MSVTRLEIERREPVLNGAAFGAAGPYEKIVGMLHFEVDPGLRVHETIADLERAPRNAAGRVESSADFYLLRPLGGGRRRLLLDVPNRGRKIALGMFNSTPRSNDPAGPNDFGNGFLMRHGYTVAFPFARTAAEQERTGDPRPSIVERYGDRAGYLERVRREADAMVASRYLLAEDIEPVVERADLLWEFIWNRPSSGA
jgi:Alpha/beta hydrolase domain